MPCFGYWRNSFYRYGFFDGRTENKCCIITGVSTDLLALLCAGGTAAFFQTNLALSSLAAVLAATCSGLSIGTTLVLGSVCLACGIEGCRESHTPVSSMSSSNSSAASEANNPLDHIGPPHQSQMSDMVAPPEARESSSVSSNPELQPGARNQCNQEQMFSSNRRFFQNSTQHSQAMNLPTFEQTDEHNDALPLRRNSLSSVNTSGVRIAFQRQRSLSAPL